MYILYFSLDMPPPNLPYLRTYAERFQNELGFAYELYYIEYGNLRIAYIDKSFKDGLETFLCLYGRLTYSYLYQKMIPVFLK